MFDWIKDIVLIVGSFLLVLFVPLLIGLLVSTTGLRGEGLVMGLMPTAFFLWLFYWIRTAIKSK